GIRRQGEWSMYFTKAARRGKSSVKRGAGGRLPREAAFREHVAEQRPLFDGVVQRLVRVRQRVEPARRHVALHRLAILLLEQHHRERLHVQRRERERTL